MFCLTHLFTNPTALHSFPVTYCFQPFLANYKEPIAGESAFFSNANPISFPMKIREILHTILQGFTREGSLNCCENNFAISVKPTVTVLQSYCSVFSYTRKNLTTCQQDVFATGL